MSQPSAQRHTSTFISKSRYPIVANLPKAGWKNMQLKTSDERFHSDGHHFHPVSISVILPLKRDLFVLHIHYSVVEYCMQVRIASQIEADYSCRGKGRLAVYDHCVCITSHRYRNYGCCE